LGLGLGLGLAAVSNLLFIFSVFTGGFINNTNKYKYKYNSYFYCAPYSLTDGVLQKSADTCFTAVG